MIVLKLLTPFSLLSMAFSLLQRVPPRWQRTLVWSGLLSLMAAIFFVSHQSLPEWPEPAGIDIDFILKKIAHVVTYALLFGGWWLALRPNPASLLPHAHESRTLLLALAATILYAISDEWHQTFVPGRHGRLSDVFIDAGGALLALLFVRQWLLAQVRSQAMEVA